MSKHRKHRTRLTFQEKREVAKLIVKGTPYKVIAFEWDIHYSTVFLIKKKFIIIELKEKYPDGWQKYVSD